MGGKLKIVVSDLHIGAGMFTKANLLEDFNADDEFAALLAKIKAESERENKEVEFIINGDFLEFLQVPAVDEFSPTTAYPPAAYTDTSAAATIKQIKIIAANHPHIFSALTDFMRVEAPARRITIIKGNHDVNLYWPEAKACLREIMGATGVRASLLLFAEEFISRENIYVEHGHQRTEKVNRFPNFAQPLSPDDPQQLYYPPGSQFVINFFNQAEREIWWLDNIKPLTGLIWFTFKWDFSLAAKLLAGFLKHSPGLLAGSFALKDDDRQTFIKNLSDESRRKIMAQRYAAGPQFRQEVHRQVQQLLNAAGAPEEAHAFQAEADIADPLDMARREQQKVQNALGRAARDMVAQHHMQVVLFGHTHAPALEKIGDDSYYLNTGAWLWHEDLSQANDETWADLFAQPEKHLQSRRLPYARIDYADDDTLDTITRVSLVDFSGQGFVWDSKPASFFERIINWILRLFGAA